VRGTARSLEWSKGSVRGVPALGRVLFSFLRADVVQLADLHHRVRRWVVRDWV